MVDLVLGGMLVLGAIFGTRFYAGLTHRVSVPKWQGRTWLLILGVFLMGLGGIQYAPGFMSAAQWTKYFNFFDSAYEIFGGTLFLGFGVVFTFGTEVNKEAKMNTKYRLLFGIGGLIAGLSLLSDGILKLRA
jgi:hypothetical protein